MSLKNDIEMVKEELSSEEKFFEKAVITEKFVKKYKNVIIGSIVAVVVIVGANIVYTINEQQRVDAANSALAELAEDTNNTTASTRLQSLSPVLYDAWSYSQAVATQNVAALKKLSKSNAPIVNDLASYEVAQDENSLKMLDAYSSRQDAIFKDLAVVQSAILLMNENKIDEAHDKLSTISSKSRLSEVAKLLSHYGVK